MKEPTVRITPEDEARQFELRRLMKILDMTQVGLAGEIGYTVPQVCRWLHGHSRVPDLVVKYLQVRVRIRCELEPIEAFVKLITDRLTR